MISRSTIDRIMSTAIIEEVIGDFVHLKKSGTSWRGLSPFSNEKTPSFFVVPHKNLFKDFSSGKSGNVVGFLMEHEKMTYPEALRWLATKYNIPIEEDTPTAQELEERTEREELSIVTDFAHRYFRQQLTETDEGRAIGLSYFHERGFRDDLIEKFQLGYNPDRRDALTRAALEAGHSLKYLEKTGLSRQREGGEPFDFFRGRVIFPIHNISGKVIAFAGRTLKAEKDTAKYFNSPESELYVKSNVLFGLHLAKGSIVKNDLCYLVEGYTDVMALHQAGIENVVASSGTSLTEGQIKLIRRYTPNVTILYDGDPAGIRASFRGINMLLEMGMNVRVVLFPDGHDPDSYSRQVSSTELEHYLSEHALDFVAFKTQALLSDAEGDPLKRATIIRDIVESIALIPDAIKRSVYTQECSRLLQISEQVIIGEMNKVIRAKFKREHREEIPSLDEWPAEQIERQEKQFTLYYQERDLVRLLLNYGTHMLKLPVPGAEGQNETEEISVAEFLLASLEQDELQLETPIYARIAEEYAQLMTKEHTAASTHFAHHTESEVTGTAADLLANPYHLSDNWKLRHNIHPETEEMQLLKASRDCIFRLKMYKVMAMIREIEKELGTLTEEEKVSKLQQEKILLDKAKSQLAEYFGTVVI